MPLRPLKRRLSPKQRAKRAEKIARRDYLAMFRPEPAKPSGYWNREQCAAHGIILKPSKLTLKPEGGTQ